VTEPVAAQAQPDIRERAPWITRGVRSVGPASFPADLGHEIPTSLLPSSPPRSALLRRWAFQPAQSV